MSLHLDHQLMGARRPRPLAECLWLPAKGLVRAVIHKIPVYLYPNTAALS
ncbi:MAG TPA: hypothetical protein VMB46_01895 [Methanomassiliicoccales archaeon]|nr:hypothetical protein [Methanomassiliicoccales archaeon]